MRPLPLSAMRARRGKVEALDIERVLGKAEFRIEPPGGNVGKQKLADAQGDMHLVVAERGEQALLGRRRSAGCFASESGSQVRQAALSPITSRRSRRSLSRVRSTMRRSPPR